MIAMMQKGRKKVDKGNMEMYALSGDSDSDLEIPKIKKIKKKKGKQSSVSIFFYKIQVYKRILNCNIDIFVEPGQNLVIRYVPYIII